MNNPAQQFNLSKEQKQELVSKIKEYFLIERDEDLGDLGSEIILDFIIDKIAPGFYNLGISDAHRYLSERLDDALSLQKI